MRIDRLDLVKYGRFSDRTIDFSAHGVHLVIGPNEAGKSTMRDAITDLLYGIARQTAYGYLHDMRDLRISALLRGQDDRSLEVVRLKKDRDSLRDADGAVLDQRELDAVLAGVAKDDFVKVFAIDHDELRQGGAALLAGKGDLAKALFESRSSAQLIAVLDQLRVEHEKLFVQRGKNPELNAALAADGPYNTARRDLADNLLRPEMYREAVRAVDEERKERDAIVEQLGYARVEAARLLRIKQAYAGMAERARLLNERAELVQAGPRADQEAARRYERLREDRQEAQITSRGLQESIAQAQAKLDQLAPDQAALNQADEITYLNDESNAIASAQKRCAQAQQTAAELRQEAANRLAKARPGHDSAVPIEPIAPVLRTRVDELLAQQVSLDTELRAARKHANARERALAKELAKLESIDSSNVDPGPLNAVIKAVPATLASEITALEKQCAAAEAKLRKSRRRYARFALPEHTADLALPADEEISKHRKLVDTAEKTNSGNNARREELEAELGEQRRALEKFLRHDPPPSEADLESSRSLRQRLWDQLRPGLTGDSPAQSRPPVAAYEEAVDASDDTADRMRREADRLAERKSLESSVERTEQKLSEARRQCDLSHETLRSLDERWRDLWAPSALAAPALEITTELLTALRTLREQSDDHDRIRLDLEADRSQAAGHMARLRAALGDAGAPVPDQCASLAELLESALEYHAALRDALKKRANATANSDTLRGETIDAKQEVTDCEASLAHWERQWSDLLAEHELSGTPAQVAAVLTEIDEIARLHKDAAREDGQAAQARAQVDAFTERLRTALEAAGQPPLADPARRHLEAKSLKRYLDRQAAAEAERNSLIQQIEELNRELEHSRESRVEHDTVLAALLTQNAVSDEQDLADAIERGAALRELDKHLGSVERTLGSSGVSLSQLEQEVAEQDPDQLAAQIADLDTTISRLESQRSEKDARLALVEQDLNRMNGSPAASFAADTVEQELATIVHRSQDYLRLRLAEQILLANIEAYRRENQTPVLRRAEHVFARITHGRFPELVADVNRDGRPVLRARRDSGHLVDVEEMSEGTCDQLYLALRLASLERFADEGRAMPLLLDDVLMTFDDGRTGAGLEILDEMADRFQVIVFTHHDHIGHLAKDALPVGRIHVHDITPAAV
ncbi:AAA family ATPase [Actinocrinis puniceicyclus]|uniref:AAA family ATPase n=1 Tax=Actinocrinis puniceicyclus TaxID=977794 RepID=A0A8J7WQB2_9ACTN|nr:YhaN family protein [Actinocrinis puniceicyclus]MBS2963570.1 AAA family ATPase [Actinocrinis puniceicyclus]